MGSTYEIVAIRYGTLAARRSELFLRWNAYGEPDADERLDYFFYVLSDGRETIVIDTGFEPASGIRRGRTCLRSPGDALQDLQIDPNEVAEVIVSHLHYDHIGNLALFPRAKLRVPEQELAFWSSPLARRPQFWSHVDEPAVAALLGLHGEGRVDAFGGRVQLRAGITAITVGGHSPGQQVFVVDAAGGPVVLASDSVHLYHEYEYARPFSVVVDLIQMYEAYELLRRLEQERGAVVVPGHDPRVTERFDQLAGAPSGLAYRLG